MSTPAPTSSRSARVLRHQMRQIDDRLGSSNFLRRSVNKIFPDHWSFMLGEIALYSFVILLLTGTFLTFFYHGDVNEVIYNGVYEPLRGVKVSDAYASTLHISFDVRAGLLMRQIHHWAALLFLASIVVHLCRVFFTGAYRKPREINWTIGVGLLVLGIAEGFVGYSLPDDLLSGTGVRIAYSLIEAVPVVGSYVAFFLFGSASPAASAFIPRLYIAHVLLIPGILLALISAHMMILWHQKHTDFPGPGKTERNVVGSRLWPTYALKGGGFFFIVFGALAALGAYAQINPIWLYGPYDVAQVSAGSQPDWYMGFLDGALRLMPGVETDVAGHTIVWTLLVPGLILPGILFTGLALWPWIERRRTGDDAYHNLLERPRDNAWRTAVGAMAIAFYLVLFFASSTDLLAITFHSSIQALIWTLRIALIVLPPLAFYFTRRICLGLQQKDEELVSHGYETGIVRRLPSGQYVEVTEQVTTPYVAALVRSRPELAEHLPDGRTGSQPEAEAAPPKEVPNGHRRSVAGARRALADFFVERRERRDD